MMGVTTEMTDMERVGIVSSEQVHEVVVGIVDYIKSKKPDVIDMYARGVRVMLTSNGLCIADRQKIGELKKYDNIYSIIEVLTIEELYKFMENYRGYIEEGQGSAVMMIMEHQLKEKMDDLYEDNYDLIFSKLGTHY